MSPEPSPSSEYQAVYEFGGRFFPTVGMAQYFHDRALEPENIPGYKVGGKGSLISALNAPIDGYDGEDMYLTFFDKVSAMVYRVCHNHCFEDGNKRTAMLLAVFTLEYNKFSVDWSDSTAIILGSLLGANFIKEDGLKHALLIACGFDPTEPYP